MWARTAGILGGIVLVAACATTPSARAVAEYGVVFAPDAAMAADTATLLDDVTVRLDALDAGLRTQPIAMTTGSAGPLEVWLFDDLGEGDVYGGYDRPNHRILLEAHRRHPAATLAHELVHAYEPERWSRLPAVVREGLADHMAAEAVPEIAAEMRAARAISLASWATDGLMVEVATPAGAVERTRGRVAVDCELTPIEALSIPHGKIRAAGDGQALKALYGLGLLIVRRTGVEALESLADAAGGALVSPQRLLAAARLSEDPALWEPAIDELVEGREERRHVRRMLGLGPAPRAEVAAPPANVRD